ncbi:antitoxin Xre/MbcA/ParS toxin-binding domain-containing protein [Acidovorax sp.]
MELVPALGHRRPLDVLGEPGGLDLVRNFLQRAQSGAYS